MINLANSHDPNRIAFKCAVSGATVKYGELEPMAMKYAAVLHHRFGVRRGDVALLMSPNVPTYFSAFHGILGLGAIVSPVNSLSPLGDVQRQARIANAKVVLAHPAFKPLLGAEITTDEGGRVIPVCYTDVDATGVDALPDGARAPEVAGANDTIVLPFSSGTTGLPKGVQLTNRNLVANVLQTQAAVEMRPTDIMLSVLPYFHIYGLTVMLHNMINAGGTQITFPKFDMEVYLDTLHRERATLAYVAPPLMVGFIKHPKMKTVDATCVRQVISGAAPLGEEVQRMCEPLFPHADIGQGYGLTETSPVLTLGLDSGIYGTAGSLVSDTEARILHEADDGTVTDVPAGEEGELWVRGPQVMKGYLREEDTAIVLPRSQGGEWFRTGDLGHFDQLQNLVVTDRLKELIKYKGMQVAPAELEAVLQQHPDVIETIVVGVPTEDGSGELARAHVVLRPGVEASAATEEALKQHVAAKVAPSKYLRGGVKFVEAIPKTASGKLLRRVVRDEERKNAVKAQPPQQWRQSVVPAG